MQLSEVIQDIKDTKWGARYPIHFEPTVLYMIEPIGWYKNIENRLYEVCRCIHTTVRHNYSLLSLDQLEQALSNKFENIIYVDEEDE